MAAVDLDRNGDSQDAPQFENDVIKVLVIGDPGCGKSSFIRTFCEFELAAPIFVNHGAYVYRYDFFTNGVVKKFAFVEIPCLPNAQDIFLHYGDARGCIFMYAVDDPSSFDHLDYWITQVGMYITLPPMKKIIVGFKNDLRFDPQVIQRLATENRTTITFQQGRDLAEHHQFDSYFECCRDDLVAVTNAFSFILHNTHLSGNFQQWL